MCTITCKSMGTPGQITYLLILCKKKSVKTSAFECTITVNQLNLTVQMSWHNIDFVFFFCTKMLHLKAQKKKKCAFKFTEN